jgi:hypothetical protein
MQTGRHWMLLLGVDSFFLVGAGTIVYTYRDLAISLIASAEFNANIVLVMQCIAPSISDHLCSLLAPQRIIAKCGLDKYVTRDWSLPLACSANFLCFVLTEQQLLDENKTRTQLRPEQSRSTPRDRLFVIGNPSLLPVI